MNKKQYHWECFNVSLSELIYIPCLELAYWHMINLIITIISHQTFWQSCQGGMVGGDAWKWAYWETVQCRRDDTCHIVPQWDDRAHGDGPLSAMCTSLEWFESLVVFLVTVYNTIIMDH